MAYVNESVQRHNIADYIDTSATETPSYELMGTGFTTLDESPNAQVKSSKYINNPTATKITPGYETQFPFNSDLIASETAVKKIHDIATLQKTGGDCELGYVRVNLFEPAIEGDEPVANTFVARKFKVAVEVSGITDSDGTMTVSGNLNQAGVMDPGTFNTQTKTFTADE